MDLGGRKQKGKPLGCGENQGGFGTRGVNQMVSKMRGVKCLVLKLK